ncbi:thiol:disulfide interchange protein DsbG [Caballeronia zhejiangensis]|uniref:Thiol:disulfide interchange protein n=2 Tax=Burkholderiaceae TaxID=119060 RepID=A0A656Q9S1_9BURK|nr:MULTISPECIES: thiol:disulfide interchange protein DsbG [Caballeronia]KDR25266.1 disulfide isomerase [Caballeronia zhejiangensis]
MSSFCLSREARCGNLLRVACFSGLLSLFAAPAPVSSADLPPVIKTLQAQGMSLLGPLPAPPGMTGWAGRAGVQPLALYVTKDGQDAIAGTFIDRNGNDLTHDVLKASAEPSISKELWAQLEHATWVVDGKPTAPKVVYVFTDPNCPYCSRFWVEARPWVDAGRMQIRHVLVGILTPSSPGKAAALLTSRDPSSALHDYEARQTKTVDAQMAAGHARALEDKTLPPLDPIPVDIAKKLAANAELMHAFTMQATPGFVWRDNAGAVQARTGLPPDQLESVLGPKPR